MVCEPFNAADGKAKVVNGLLFLLLLICFISTMVTFGGSLAGISAPLIFAFLSYLIHLPLTFARLAGFTTPIAKDVQSSIRIEFYLSFLELFCFFIQTAVWGGTCFTPLRNLGAGTSVVGKGYGLIIACLFFIVIYTFFYFMMRRDDSWVVGAGATRSGGGSTSTAAYEAESHPASSGYEASDAGQPTFSYQANTPDAPATSL